MLLNKDILNRCLENQSVYIKYQNILIEIAKKIFKKNHISFDTISRIDFIINNNNKHIAIYYFDNGTPLLRTCSFDIFLDYDRERI